MNNVVEVDKIVGDGQYCLVTFNPDNRTRVLQRFFTKGSREQFEKIAKQSGLIIMKEYDSEKIR